MEKKINILKINDLERKYSLGYSVKEYSKHGDINTFIAKHHKNKVGYIEYREKWQNNKDTLLFLCIETTSTCNLKCPMCIHSIGYGQTEAMGDEVFKIIEKQIKEMEIPSVCMNGTNEPLLDKKIFERIKKVSRIECVMDIHMNTNAILLNRENSLELLKSKLTRLLISFDAFSKEIYEKVRPRADFGRVMKNIQNFLEQKNKMNKILPVERISFVKNSLNEHELEKWFNYWKEKVDYIYIQEYRPPALDRSKDYLIPKSLNSRQKKQTRFFCREPFERVVIRGNGDVLPCCNPLAINMPIGNIKQDSLRNIWYGQKAVDFRSYFEKSRRLKHQVCSECQKASYILEPRDP